MSEKRQKQQTDIDLLDISIFSQKEYICSIANVFFKMKGKFESVNTAQDLQMNQNQ